MRKSAGGQFYVLVAACPDCHAIKYHFVRDGVNDEGSSNSDGVNEGGSINRMWVQRIMGKAGVYFRKMLSGVAAATLHNKTYKETYQSQT